MSTNRTRIIIRDIVIDTAPTNDTGAFGGGGGGGGGDVDPPPPPPPPTPTGWKAFTESLSIARWQTNTGLVALQYINPWDSSTVTFSTSPTISAIADKSGNGNDFLVSGNTLIIDGNRNSVRSSASGYAVNNSTSFAITGNMFDKPFVVGLAFTFRRFPTTNKEAIWSCGNDVNSGNRVLYVNSNGTIEYAYTPDGGSTYSTTSVAALPLDIPVLIWLSVERSRLRVYIQSQTNDHTKMLSCNGGINNTLSVIYSTVGAWYVSGQFTNMLSVADWHGMILASGVVKNTFNAIEQTCDLFGIPWINSDVSTLDNGLVGELVFPGPGGATPTGDAVELINNIKFTAAGTVATATGAFHNDFSQAADANRLSNTTAVDATWDLYNKASFTLHLKVKPSEVTSNRTIFQVGTSPYLRVFHQDIGGGVYKIRVSLNGVTTINSTTTIANGNWYDVHVWADNSLTVNLQVNGDTVTTGARAAYASSIGQGIYIGSTNTPSFYYRGEVDQIRLWDRALTLEERKQTSISAGSRDGFCQYLQSGVYSGSWGGGGAAPTVYYVGSMVAGITNGNVQLKSSSTAAGSTAASWVTFISPKSGALRQFQAWWKTNTAKGYSGGTRGAYTVSVRTDNGSNAPSATVVSELTGITNFLDNDPTDNIRTLTFSTIGNVVAGTKYHMIIANTASSPSTNWCCFQNVQNSSGVSKPVWGAGDFGYHHGGNPIGVYSYSDAPTDLVFGLDTNGDSTVDYYFGNPYISPVSPNYYTYDSIGGAVYGGFMVKFNANYVVQKFTFAGYRTAGTGDITVQLKTALSGGTVLATATIQGSQLASAKASPTQWATGTFNTEYTCQAGVSYYIVMSAPSGTVIYPSLLQDTANGYGGPSTIDGTKGGWWGNTSVLQKSTNSGSTWGGYVVSGKTGKHDVSFYFTGY